MKAYTTSVIVWLIIAVIVGMSLLAIAWYRGLLPFGKASSEAICRAKIMNACEKAKENNWKAFYVFNQNDVKSCDRYFPNLDYCISTSSRYNANNCVSFCENFL